MRQTRLRFKRTTIVGVILAALVLMPAGWQARAWPEDDQGCYCHNLGVAIYINGSDVAWPIIAQKGQTFSLDLKTVRMAVVGILPAVLAWEPNITDNSKFAITPANVIDNSADDLDNSTGNIETLFKITAPSVEGSYVIYVTAQGNYVGFIVNVGLGTSTPVNSSQLYSPFASITQVSAPASADEGSPVQVNVTVQNVGIISGRMFFYAVDGATGEILLPSVFADSNVSSFTTATLMGEFVMPNRSLQVVVRVGHVENGVAVDDGSKSQAISMVPQKAGPTGVSFPWIWVVAAVVPAVAGLGYFLMRSKSKRAPR
jgi:hypothetical protein